MSTKNLGPAQLELVGQLQFQSSRLTSFAPFIVGLWLDTIGLGIVLALVRWASTVSATDKITTRVLVYHLLFISLTTSGYLIAMTLHQFAAGFGEYRPFLDTRWLRPAYALYALSRFPSQVFLAHRTWQMYDGNWGVPVVLAPLILTATGCGFGVAATLDQVPIPHISRQLIWAYTSSDLAADVIITSLLAYAFYSRRTGWDHTDRLITRLLRVLVETQAPPALVAVVYIIITAVAANGTELAYFAGAAKVHVACLIFVVNSRVDVRRETHGTSFIAGPGVSGGGVGGGSGSGNGSASANANAHKHSHSHSHSHALGVVSGLGRSRTGRSLLDRESIELGSTDHIRIDKHTFEVSEPREDYGFKAGINRQDSALTAPSDIELDYARRTAHADMFSDGATPPPRRQ